MIALAIVLSGGWHGALRHVLADLRFAWQSRQASGDIVVVAIDAQSIDKIGVWPWPRLLHAELLRQLQKADVQDIALDVDFSTPSDAASDRNFAEALESAGGSVVLPSFQQPRTDRTTLHVNRPLQQFSEHSWPAVVNVEVGPDGLVRRYPFGEKLDDKFVPSMAAVLSGQYAEKRAPFLIDFSIRTSGIPKVSFVDVLRGDEATLQKLRGKKVIVGGTALELGDRFSVPNGVILSGPVLQTLAAESLLQNRALQWTSTHRHADRACPARIDHAAHMASPLRRQAGSDARCNGGRHRSRRAPAAGKVPAHPRHIAVSHRHLRLHRRHRARRNRHQGSARPGRREPVSARGDVARRRPDLHRFQLPDHGLESRRDGDFRLSAGGDDRPAVRRDLRPRRAAATPAFSIRNAAKLARLER